MTSSIRCCSWLLSLLLAGIFTSQADVRLPAIFSEHAVLQKAEQVPVWGWAEPGEIVSVTLDGTTAKTKGGTDGKWKTALNLQNKTAGPFELIVEGKNKIQISDVVVGEVWLCSGQSNMDRTLSVVLEAKEEIEQSQNPLLRQFLVGVEGSTEPLENCKGSWVVASPETSAKFTAVGYYFGKTLQNRLRTPVGLINSASAGTPCESWMREADLDKDQDLKESKDRKLSLARNYPEFKKQFPAAMQQWLKENGREDIPGTDTAAYTGADIKTENWTPITIPQKLPAKLAQPGVLWLRKEITVPQNLANKGIRLQLVFASGYDAVYWNGVQVGKSTIETYKGKGAHLRYGVPGKLVREGTNILAIRLYAPIETPAIHGQTHQLIAGGMFLDGEWLATSEKIWPALDEATQETAPDPLTSAPRLKYYPSCLFNGMIHPLIPYAIRGCIWYQGESNVKRAWQYRTTFPLLIQGWRAQWGQGDFPFYFCQLANYMEKTATPGQSDWAELREAQTAALTLPRTGMANLIDLGEAKDIHPRNKKDAGERLALIALAKDYQEAITFAGPEMESVKLEGERIRVRFKNIDGGLVARPLPGTYPVNTRRGEQAPLVRNSPGSQVEGFAVCGSDKVWKWAQAGIDGDNVIVSSSEVPAPTEVRYGWADNPTVNLYNGAGLPAFPFRTDDFPLTTSKQKY